MNTKKSEPKSVFIVVTDMGYYGSYPTYEKARKDAESQVNSEETCEAQIFEVVKSWYVQAPEEPMAETYEQELSSL